VGLPARPQTSKVGRSDNRSCTHPNRRRTRWFDCLFFFDLFPAVTARRTAAHSARQALRPIALQIVEDRMILTPNR
jgi:hypothetical protein